MSTKDQQLSPDHQKVKEISRKYKNITLVSTAGEPVDEYDLEYKVKGYSNSPNGSIKVTRQHRVKIQLPFGYPHFPPTLKPLSPIFHPDVDANVVRIADYWEKNKSLPDLILHIGEMICGKVYSTENPFNVEAAEYYKDHEDSLPLDSLQLASDDTPKVSEKPPIEFNIPIFKILFVVCFVAVLGAGGLYFFEKSRLGKAEQGLEKAIIFEQDLEYQRAHDIAQSAHDDLQNFFLLKSPSVSLRSNIEAFLQSESLQEGLKGKIPYEGRFVSKDIVEKLQMLALMTEKAEKHLNNGSVSEATQAYEEAFNYADENDLTVEGKKIHDILADLKLQELNKLMSSSEEAHKSQNLSVAIDRHRNTLAFIKQEHRFLENGGKEQASRILYLLLLDQISISSTKLTKAGSTKNNLENSLKSHTKLIEFIEKSGSKSNKEMQKNLAESKRQVAVLSAKLEILRNREWLLTNYKKIFPKHYPAVVASSLSNPKATLVRHVNNNQVYDLNCLEKGQGSVVRLRIYYQYDRDTRKWSLYNGKI